MAAFGMPGGQQLFNPLNLPYPNPQNLIALAAAANQSPLHSIASSTNSTNANPTNSPFPNLANKLNSSGIFPATTLPNFPPFNGFNKHLAPNNMVRNDE
jgi:hypothetical protein